MSAKYAPLGAFLRNRDAAEVPMTFAEIESVIRDHLPPKAQAHRAWWSNNPSNNVMTKVWLDAGFRTERVDMASRRLVFRRTARLKAVGTHTTHAGADILARIQQSLGGTVRFLPEVDLTGPTGETWDSEIQ